MPCARRRHRGSAIGHGGEGRRWLTGKIGVARRDAVASRCRRGRRSAMPRGILDGVIRASVWGRSSAALARAARRWLLLLMAKADSPSFFLGSNAPHLLLPSLASSLISLLLLRLWRRLRLIGERGRLLGFADSGQGLIGIQARVRRSRRGGRPMNFGVRSTTRGVHPHGVRAQPLGFWVSRAGEHVARVSWSTTLTGVGVTGASSTSVEHGRRWRSSAKSKGGAESRGGEGKGKAHSAG